ncbi:MAG: class I adenylate-forming enzyme family protein [Mycobacterium sp.]|uniref:class I adenylate-forming enzyme family protein n=1 Tax=Mycobacterium sp. TaxID=1785 RepID=UPI003F9CEF40
MTTTSFGPQSDTYPELIATFADRPVDAVAVRDESTTLTYRELYDRIGALAAWLADSGVAPGDTVAIMIASSAELLIAQLACQAIGAVGALVNTSLVGQALRHVIELADPTTILADPHSASQLRKESLQCHSLQDPDMAAALRASRDPIPFLRQRSCGVKDPAFINFTSGTTGFPKGVVLEQRTSSRAMVIGALLGLQDSAESFYIPTPVYHAMGLALASMGLRLGATLILRRHFSASNFWSDIRDNRCTLTYYVGTMPRMIFNQPPKPLDAHHHLKAFIGGGMPADIWEEFATRFNVKIVESYSASDTVGTINNFGNAPVGSIGQPSPDIEARLVDADGIEVAVGEPGELLVRPRQRTAEPAVVYYRDDQATREKNEGGWVHTGDLMRADAAGNYYYVDRLRHMIRRRGVNIASREIEDILAAHQSIAECAAIAVPAPLGEDDIKVVVRPAVDALSENDVAEIAAALLPKHMCPRYVELVAELPLTITQRVKQFELKQEWQTVATWDVEMRTYPFREPRA